MPGLTVSGVALMPIVAFEVSPPMPRPRLVTIGASAPLSQSATLTTDPAAWEGPAAATAMTRAATGSESVFRRRRISFLL